MTSRPFTPDTLVELREQLGTAFEAALSIEALGTSDNPLGYGPPYKAPWFIIDTSTAEPEVNWPGELIEEVAEVDRVGKALRRAQVDRLLALLTPLLDATHEAACRAMREEAAKVSIEVAKHPFGYSGSSAAYRIAADIHALHLPKREG